jgi:hypothetical protein
VLGNEEVEGTNVSRKWLTVNDEVAYKRIINCTNVGELRHIGKLLYKIRCKWENKISNIYYWKWGRGSIIIVTENSAIRHCFLSCGPQNPVLGGYSILYREL